MALFRRSRRPPAARPKTYLYVSDAKVEMLTEGLDRSILERFDLKVGVAVPGADGVDVEFSPRQLELGRYARAERLCAALDAQGRVGSVSEEESEFFRGQMPVAWGFWNRYNEGYADVVFFSGFADENTFLGLGGSAYHTMERADDRLQQYSNSGLQTLMGFLKERSEALRVDPLSGYGPPDAWDAEGWDADHDNSTVPEEVEFVAERLLDRPRHGVRSIIGSPIYVARTGQPTTGQVLKEYEALRNRFALEHYKKPRLKKRHGRREIGKSSSPQPAPLLEPAPTETDDDRSGR